MMMLRGFQWDGRDWLWRGILLLWVVVSGSLTGCISVPFEVAGGIIEATGSVVESVVEVPIDIADSLVDTSVDVADSFTDTPSSFKCKFVVEQDWCLEDESINFIDLKNTNGKLVIYGSDREKIFIQTRKEILARSQSLAEKYADEVQIRVERQNDTLHIYKTPFNSQGNRYREVIDYEIEIPWRMNLSLSVHNGPIEISQIEGSIHIDSQNGRIDVRHCSGSLNAKTNNGSIHAEIDRVTGRNEWISQNGSINVILHEVLEPVTVETHNGNATLSLPIHFEGYLDASTNNGHVESEIPVRVHAPRHDRLIGKIGNGEGPHLSVHTHNGSVRVKGISE